MLAVKDTIGGSSSFQTITAQWIVALFLRKTFPYMEVTDVEYLTGGTYALIPFLRAFGCLLNIKLSVKLKFLLFSPIQVVYVFGAMLGVLMSAAASDTVQTTKAVPYQHALTGGILMLFGARLASGCTRYVKDDASCKTGAAQSINQSY